MIATVTFPLMLGMLITAEPLVAAILGSRWMPVAPLLMILALVGMVQSIATTVGHIYMAKGRTDWMFRWGMAASTLAVASFVIGLSWGIVGVAAAYGIVSLLLAYPNFAIPFRLIDLSVKDLVVSLWPVLRSSLIMLSCVAILRIALNWLGITQPWAMLGIMVTVGIIAYVVALVVSRSPVLLDVLELLPLRQVSWLQWIVAVMGLDTCHGNRL
jgi:PST family polysaccharide transporter